MEGWKSALKADPTEWLLEPEDPSARYFALRDLLDRGECDRDVLAARRALMESGRVPAILAAQREPAYIGAYPRFYTDKYRGLVWQLITLAELGAEANGQIREQCAYLLENAQERGEGGFSQHASARLGGGLPSEVIPCLTGNMVWSLIRLGCLDDPRVRKGIGWLTRFMRFNDGEETDPQVPPYDRYEMCWGRHTCLMGAVKALKALSAIPEGERSAEVNETIGKAAEFLLIHRVYKRSHNLNRASKPGWLKFGFPLMYQTDALEILDILTGLNVRDGRMEDAVRVVLNKQGEDGRWRLENTYAGDRMLVPMGEKDEPSKFVTLRAMRVLKRYFSS